MFEDLTGKRFGNLVVITIAEKNPTYPRDRNWKVLCDCGRETFVITGMLNSNRTHTCGLCHFHTESLASKRRTHGRSHSKLYSVWKNMRSRCRNSKRNSYKNYGARGIDVCNDWYTSFESFASWAILSGYKEGLLIERINNNSNYCPVNCAWATVREQSLNRRTNRLIFYNNETKPLIEWAKIFKLNPNTVGARLNRGWTVERALSTPATVKRRRG